MKRRFQRYLVRIVSAFHVRVEYISAKNRSFC